MSFCILTEVTALRRRLKTVCGFGDAACCPAAKSVAAVLAAFVCGIMPLSTPVMGGDVRIGENAETLRTDQPGTPVPETPHGSIPWSVNHPHNSVPPQPSADQYGGPFHGTFLNEDCPFPEEPIFESSPFHPGFPESVPPGGFGLLLPDPVSQLPPVYVHQRRTVRSSERAAEIWVRLPKDSECSVSVNFVEYPLKADFRIFRAVLTTQEPRRFYLSAKRWDVKANRWADLVAMPSLRSEESPGFDYVDLLPGQRRIVQFDNLQMPSVTTAFLFKPTEQQIDGTATLNDATITSINWMLHPDILNASMAANPFRLSELPDRPFVARVTFAIQDPTGLPFATLKPILVTFVNGTNSVEGEIHFNKSIAGPLQEALVSSAVPIGTYRIKARMEFMKDMGDTGYSTIIGELGNDIELNINP